MSKRLISCFFACVFVFVSYSHISPAFAENNPLLKGKIVFQDNFESSLSQWNVTQPGNGNSASTLSTQHYVGQKSLSMQYTNGGANYILVSKDTPNLSDASIKVFFYDDLDSSMGTFFEVRDNENKNGTALGVMTAQNICPSCNPNRYTIRINSFEDSKDTGINRSKGWHAFEFKVNSSGTTAWIDGVEIQNRNTIQKTLGSIQFVSSWGLTSTAIYDEVKVVDNTNTAPCQNSVSDTFSDLSKWTISESYSQNTISYGTAFDKNAVIQEMGNAEGYTLMTYVLCNQTQGKVTMDFYDDLSNKGTLFSIYSGNIEQDSSSPLVGVGVWSNFNDKNRFLDDGDTYKYRVTNAYSPQNSTIPTGIKRKKGWHTLELFSTPVGAFARIDGINLTSINGKKHNQGFTYNINTDRSFKEGGIKSIGLVSTYNSTGQNYFANLRFESLPAFNYTKSDSSMSDLSFAISKYFLNQYPNSVNRDFYKDIMQYYANIDLWKQHNLAQEYNHITTVALILAYDFRTTGNKTSLNRSVDLFKYITESAPKLGKCNSTPYFMANYTATTKLLWNSLDTETKRASRDAIYNEAIFWRDVDFNSKNIPECTNPWPGTRNRLPFTRTGISASEFNLMNSASRDNAWTSAFFNLAGSFAPIILKDSKAATDFRTMGEILAYHSLDRSGDQAFGIHPAAPNEGVIKANATILDNFNLPLWSNPNPFYALTTVQQISRGTLFNDAKGSGNNYNTNYFHNWKDVVNRAENFIDYSTLRAKSSSELAEGYRPNFQSFEYYGKGHQYEDLSVQVDTLAALSKLPQSQTGLSNSTYKDRLFEMLKYEFYTLQGNPRLPWYPDGKIDNVTAMNTQTAPMDGWGDFPSIINYGLVLPNTHHLAMVVNGVVAIDHVYAAIFLNPSFVNKIDIGDLNNDNKITTSDLSEVFQDYGKNDLTSDLNLDGQVNNFDVKSLWQQ